jgi:hypothetical protein
LVVLENLIIKILNPHVEFFSSRYAKQVQRDIEDIITNLSGGGDGDFPPIKVILVDSNLAKVYANTNKSSIDFREYPAVLKQAISTARRLQDPLVEFSQLCNPENDILCLRYHPLQDMVGDEDLLQAGLPNTNAFGLSIRNCKNQCCGSGIRCLFSPWFRDPGWVKNLDPDPG